MQGPNPQTLSLLGICNTSTHTGDKNINSPICDSKTTLKSLDHQHLWWLENAATFTTPDPKILQGIISVEDMRDLFGNKTQDTKEAHSSLSKNPYKKRA